MGFRFRKSFKIAPGVRLNLNKKSTSLTFGGKGLHYTINSSGKKTASAGIPGTGLYYTESSGGSSGRKSNNRGNNNYSSGNLPPDNPNVRGNTTPQGDPNSGKGCAIAIISVFIIIICIILFSVVSKSEDNSATSEPSNTEIDAFEQYVTEKITNESSETETQTEKQTQPSTEKSTNKQPTTDRATAPTVKPTKPTEPATKPIQAEITYVLNTNTKVYHTMNCRHVEKIKPEHYQESKTVPSDYKPCGTCHPDR